MSNTIDPENGTPHVVVCGCGFAGLAAARTLAAHRDGNFRMSVLNDKPYLYDYPALPRALCAGYGLGRVTHDLRPLLEPLGISLVTSRIGRIDTVSRQIEGDNLTLTYDYLVLATGNRAEPLDQHPGFQVFYPKSFRHLRELRQRLQAHAHAGGEIHRLVIVGGGLTGCEFAAAIASLVRRLDRCSPIRITLLERAPEIAGEASPRFRRALADELKRRGVILRCGEAAERALPEGVQLADGSLEPADTVVCAIGGRPNITFECAGLARSPEGIVVDATLAADPAASVFIAGDLAATGDHLVIPKRAASAVWTGRHCAQNIIAAVNGRPRTAFRPRHLGTALQLDQRAALLEKGPLLWSGLAGLVAKRLLERWYRQN